MPVEIEWVKIKKEVKIMKNNNYEFISSAIWRSGYIKDKNKLRQEAKESITRLIVFNLVSELQRIDKDFDAETFKNNCLGR